MVKGMIKLTALILASTFAVPQVTWAQAAPCAPLADITKQLSEGKYHEFPVVHAIAQSGAMLLVFASADGATWTLVGVRPADQLMGCVLAVGTDWQTAKPPPAGRPS